MCTVTYLPRAGSGFILTSNRDEHKDRAPASNPGVVERAGKRMLFPRDGQAGGTWLSAAADGRVSCLLNGAFKKHKHVPPYRLSRGIVVLDSFNFSIEDFQTTYDFDGIEPFTMVMVRQNPKKQLFEFRWDGATPHLIEMNVNTAQLWSSSTLYDEEAQQKRQGWFEDWKEIFPNPSGDRVLEFHHMQESTNIENSFVMQRENGVQTVSVTQVTVSGSVIWMSHENLIAQTIANEVLTLTPA